MEPLTAGLWAEVSFSKSARMENLLCYIILQTKITTTALFRSRASHWQQMANCMALHIEVARRMVGHCSISTHRNNTGVLYIRRNRRFRTPNHSHAAYEWETLWHDIRGWGLWRWSHVLYRRWTASICETGIH